MANTTSKIKLKHLPDKRPNAWLCNFSDCGEHWVPYSVIRSWIPSIKTIEIDKWWLLDLDIIKHQ